MDYLGGFLPKRKFPTPNPPTAVSFQSLTANGTSGTVSTTQLTATFDIDPGLTTANFVVTGASKGVVSKVGAVYTINIHTITVEDGQSVTLDIIDVPSGFTISPLFRTVAVNVAPASDLILKTYDYTPTYFETSFTLPAQDANGWSILTPSVDSRVLYVSEIGDDTNAAANGVYVYGDGSEFTDWFADEGQVAFATIEAAQAYMRDGYPDYLLLNRADDFTLTGKINIKAGRSASERSVYGVYGSGARPQIIALTSVNLLSIQNKNNIAVVSWDFYPPWLDPESPDFLGWDWISPLDSSAISTFGGESISGILVEDCRARFFNRLITTTSANDGGFISDIILRRNVPAYTYKTDANATHAQGFGLGVGSYLIDENVFVNCGWYDNTSDTNIDENHPSGLAGGTQFAHATYINSPVETIICRNLISQASSIGHKLTSSSLDFRLHTALTGAEETEVHFRDYVPVEKMFYPFTFNVTTDLDALIPVTAISGANNRFTIAPTDFSGDNTASVGNWLVPTQNYIRTYDLAIYDELMVGGEIVASIGGNTDLDNENPRFRDVYIQGVTGVQIGNWRPTGRALGYGPDLSDADGFVITELLMTPTTNPAVTNKKPFSVDGYINDISLTNSVMQGMGDAIYTSDDTGASAEVSSSVVNIPDSEFVDPNRTIETYLQSIGETATIDHFNTLLLEQGKHNWDERLLSSTIMRYFREGFALKNNFYVITQPTDIEVNSGESATLTFNVIGNTRLTWVWYVNDEAVPGETGINFTSSFTSTSAVRGEAFDENGNSIESATAIVTVTDQNQFFYDINNEENSSSLPSFMRPANNTAAYTSSIAAGIRPDGEAGKLWELGVTGTTSAAFIFNEISKQSVDVEILILSKGSNGATYIIPRPSPRIQEDTVGSTEPSWVNAGIRPFSSEIRVRSRISGVTENNASAAYPGGVINWPDFFWYQRVKMTTSGDISVSVWPYGETEPSSPQLTYTDASNRLFGEYLGIAGFNPETQLIAFASVGLNGESAPLAAP